MHACAWRVHFESRCKDIDIAVNQVVTIKEIVSINQVFNQLIK